MRILHDHNAEKKPRKKWKWSGNRNVKENSEGALVDSTFVQGSNRLKEKMETAAVDFSCGYSKGVSKALEPHIRYMMHSWAEVSSKHPGMAKSSFPVKWLVGIMGGKSEQNEVLIGDLAGKMNFKKETGGRKVVRSREGYTGRKSQYTDWAQVASESRKKQWTAASVNQKSVQNSDGGGGDEDSAGRSPIILSKSAEAGASSSYSEFSNLDTTFIEVAGLDVEVEVVDGFRFEASNTMFPSEKVEQENQLKGEDDGLEAEEVHNLESRFGIEVLSFKEHRCSLSMARSV